MNTLFQPVSGKLGQLIFESPDNDIGPRLEFFIELQFAEAEIDNELVKPFFRASGICCETGSWRELENTTHQFPWAPKPGSVDAAMLLFGFQNPADVVALEFGSIHEGSIKVSFSTEVDFEIEADRDELGQVEIEISEIPLEIAPLKISTSFEKRYQGDPDAITAAMADLVDISAYGPVIKVPGGFEMEIA